MLRAPIVKIINSSVVDGPGNRAAVFLQGCNFNCKFCHNPETIHLEGYPGEVHMMTVSEVLDEVANSLPFIRGLTVSGGECMLYEEFVIRLCRTAKRRFGQNFSCLLDSNGSLPFDRVLPFIDGVMLDIKAFDESAHRALTGASNEQVLAQAVFLAEHGKLAELRTVVFRDTLAAESCIIGLSDLLHKTMSRQVLASLRYKLIKYRPKGVRPEYLRDLAVPTDLQMEELRHLAFERGFSSAIII